MNVTSIPKSVRIADALTLGKPFAAPCVVFPPGRAGWENTIFIKFVAAK